MSKLISKYGKTFTILPNTFIMNPNISSDAKCLMLVLQQYAWTNNEVFPSVKTLLYHLAWSEHIYRKARKELEDKGFIEVIQQRDEGKFNHNIYILNPEHIYEIDADLKNIECDNIEDDKIECDKSSANKTNIYNKTNNINNTNNKKDNSLKQLKQFKNSNTKIGKLDDEIYEEIISYLNNKTGKNFKSSSKSNRTLIDNLFKEGYNIEDIKYVLDIKYDEWKDTEFYQYYTPSTLFKLEKFEKYVNQEPIVKSNKKGTPASFPGQENNVIQNKNSRRK